MEYSSVSDGHRVFGGLAFLCSGSTSTQGPYAKNISRTTDFLLSKSRANGLIGDQVADVRYTYGHGFAMLFLSQILGEEGLLDRREELVAVLNKAVDFCGKAQTPSGGWGYVSAKDANDYDEGSTTITQVQGLRGCRNAGSRSCEHHRVGKKVHLFMPKFRRWDQLLEQANGDLTPRYYGRIASIALQRGGLRQQACA